MKYLVKLNTLNKTLLLLLTMIIGHYLYNKFYLIEGNDDGNTDAKCITNSDLDSKENYFNTTINNYKTEFDKKITDLNTELQDISRKCSMANDKASSVGKSITS